MTGPITLLANVTEDTTNGGAVPAGAPMTFSSDVTGPFSFAVNGGTGGAVSVGGNLNTNVFTVTNSNSTTITGTTTVPTVNLTNTTGAITFNGAVAISTALNTSAQGYSVAFNNGGTITPATTFLNTGGVSLNSGASPSLEFTNGFTSTASTTTISGTLIATTPGAGMTLGTTIFSPGSSFITTNAGAFNAGTTTLNGNASIDTTNGGAAAGGAPILFSSNVTGPFNFAVNGGTGGAVSVGGNLNTNVFTVTNSNSTTITGTTTVPTVNLTSTTGAITFNGAVAISTALNTSAQGYSVALNNGGTITPATTFLNTGGVSLNSGASPSLEFTNGFTSTASTTTISGTLTATTPGAGMTLGTTIFSPGSSFITTNAGAFSAGATTLNGNASIDTTNGGAAAGGAPILFSSNVTGPFNFAVNGGTGGAVSVGGNLNTNVFTVTNSNSTTITGTTTVPTVNLTNTTGAITFNGAVAISTALNTSAQGYSVAFNNGGTITPATTFLNTGGVSLNSGASPSLEFTNGFTSTASTTTISGTLTATTPGAGITLGTTIFSPSSSVLTTNAGAFSAGATTLNGNASIDTTNGGAAGGGAPILFSSAIDGGNDLSLTAGGSNITFTGAVGGITPIGALSIASANDVTASSSITASSIAQNSGTGTTIFNGPLSTSGASGIAITTNVVNVNNTVTTTGGGPVTITNAGLLTIAPAATMLLDGPFTQNGAGLVAIGANITTSNDNISFASPVTLTQGINLSTQSTPGGGDISFLSTVDGPQALILDAGTGTVLFEGNIGGTSRLTSLNASGNVVDQDGFVHTTGPVTYNGTVLLAGDINTLSSDILLNGNVVRDETDNATLSTSGGPANITITGTLDADTTTRNLTLVTGTTAVPLENIISLGGTVGNTGPLNQLTLTADTVNLHDIGGLSQGVLGNLSAVGTTAINFLGTTYFANNQTYTLPSLAQQFNLVAGSPTTFNTLVGPVQFVGGTVKLASGNDLTITALNIPQTIEHIEATTCENVSIFIGTGALTIGNLGNLNPVGNLTAMAGTVLIDGPINLCGVIQVQSIGNISDPSGFVISSQSVGSMIFNSVNGTAGTQSLPLHVNFPNGTVFAGAPDLASFAGITTDGTIHRLPSNPPCVVFFNNIKIFDCHFVPPPPPPPNPPSPITPAVIHDFFIPGTYSLFDTLADDWYFFPDFWEFCRIDPYLFECGCKKSCL